MDRAAHFDDWLSCRALDRGTVASGTFQLSSFSGFPPLGNFVASSDAVPVNITDASTSRLQFAWQHQVPLSAVGASYIELTVSATSGDLVVEEPSFGLLIGASTLGATPARSTFLGHASQNESARGHGEAHQGKETGARASPEVARHIWLLCTSHADCRNRLRSGRRSPDPL